MFFKIILKDNSKFKKAWSDAIKKYQDMRGIAKAKINELVRSHHPQEDVDTIRGYD